MWAEASPARKFLRKANYYVVTQAQSVYDILAYAGVQRVAARSDVKEQKSAKKKTLSSIAKALHSINKEKILFFARPRLG